MAKEWEKEIKGQPGAGTVMPWGRIRRSFLGIGTDECR